MSQEDIPMPSLPDRRAPGFYERAPNMELISIPLPGGGQANLPKKMTSAQWERLHIILSAYEEGIVQLDGEHAN